MKQLSKKVTTVVETSRNTVEEAKALQRREEKSRGREGDGRSERTRTEEEKQFKEPPGGSPQKISRNLTPLLAQEWGADMHL